MRTDEFLYDLPEELIAQSPVEPRDSARLLRVGDLSDHVVRDLPALLQPGDLLVVNTTRVRAARLRGSRRDTGGAVEILLLHPVPDGWQALVRPARRLRAGTAIEIGRLTAELRSDPVDGQAVVALDGAGAAIDDLIAEVGEMPLPPYIHERLSDPDRYQTIYANRLGSAAAPTAGLHFTDGLFNGLAAQGIERADVELQVGLDTFRPITTETIEDHRMHSEWISVPATTVAAVERARQRGGRVVAVGTTVVRSLESAAASGSLEPFQGPTSLYIMPGYGFRVVDLLLTNFHIPGSSLLVLVAAFAGDRWRRAYEAAVERCYRFLSFGDVCLFERTPS